MTIFLSVQTHFFFLFKYVIHIIYDQLNSSAIIPKASFILYVWQLIQLKIDKTKSVEWTDILWVFSVVKSEMENLVVYKTLLATVSRMEKGKHDEMRNDKNVKWNERKKKLIDNVKPTVNVYTFSFVCCIGYSSWLEFGV